MPDERKVYDNSGAIFNNASNPNAKAPYGGSAVIEGKEFWVNAWVKEGSQGKFFSLSFRPKHAPAEKPRQEAWSKELDDEVPF